MDCEICGKFPHRGPFVCATCARSAIYPLRLEYATMLLEKEAMARKVEAVVGGTGSGSTREKLSLSGAMIDTYDCAKAYEMEQMSSNAIAHSERINLIADKAKQLRLDMEEHRKTIAAKKREIAQRRSDAESAAYGLEARDARELEGVHSGIRRVNRRREQKQQEIIAGRYSLCREAARLAGLRRIRRKRDDGVVREYFTIGDRLPVFDLRELHTANPEQLTASLTQLAYLTTRAATYLGLRLPAEITLPHRGYPLATIFSPSSSYLSRDVPFPGTTPTPSTRSLLSSQSQDQRPLPHPRTLFIDMKLSQLLKDDSSAFSLFIEGVTLLAWDIAWLCKVQGMSGFDSEVDLCPLGRNLWNLFFAEPKSVSTSRVSSNRDEPKKDNPTPSSALPDTNPPMLFGQLSHSTTIGFFGASEGRDMMRGWKLQSPTKAVDKRKDYLKAEIQKAEWEFLDGKDLDGQGMDEGDDEEPVLVPGGRAVTESRQTAVPSTLRVMGNEPGELENTFREAHNDSETDGAPSTRPQGASGWTKVRTRNNFEAARPL